MLLVSQLFLIVLLITVARAHPLSYGPLLSPSPLARRSVQNTPSVHQAPLDVIEADALRSFHAAVNRQKPSIARDFSQSLDPGRSPIQHVGDTARGVARLTLAGVAGVHGAVRGVGYGIREAIRRWASENRGTMMYKKRGLSDDDMAMQRFVRRDLTKKIKDRAKFCGSQCMQGARSEWKIASEARTKAYHAGYAADAAVRKGDIKTARAKVMEEKTQNRMYWSHFTSVPGAALKKGVKALISPMPSSTSSSPSRSAASPRGSAQGTSIHPSSPPTRNSSSSSGESFKTSSSTSVRRGLEQANRLVRRSENDRQIGPQDHDTPSLKERMKAKAKGCVGECKKAFSTEIDRSQGHSVAAANLKTAKTRARLLNNPEVVDEIAHKQHVRQLKAYGRLINAPIQGAYAGAKALFNSSPRPSTTVAQSESGSGSHTANRRGSAENEKASQISSAPSWSDVKGTDNGQTLVRRGEPSKPSSGKVIAKARAHRCVGECKGAFTREMDRSKAHATDAKILKGEEHVAWLNGDASLARQKASEAGRKTLKAYGRMANAPIQAVYKGGKALLRSPLSSPPRQAGETASKLRQSEKGKAVVERSVDELASQYLVKRAPGVGNSVVSTLSRSKSMSALPELAKAAKQSAPAFKQGGKHASHLSPDAKVGLATTAVAVAGAIASNIHVAPPPITVQVHRQAANGRRKTSMQTHLGEGGLSGSVGQMNFHVPTRGGSFGRGSFANEYY